MRKRRFDQRVELRIVERGPPCSGRVRGHEALKRRAHERAAFHGVGGDVRRAAIIRADGACGKRQCRERQQASKTKVA